MVGLDHLLEEPRDLRLAAEAPHHERPTGDAVAVRVERIRARHDGGVGDRLDQPDPEDGRRQADRERHSGGKRLRHRAPDGAILELRPSQVAREIGSFAETGQRVLGAPASVAAVAARARNVVEQRPEPVRREERARELGVAACERRQLVRSEAVEGGVEEVGVVGCRRPQCIAPDREHRPEKEPKTSAETAHGVFL